MNRFVSFIPFALRSLFGSHAGAHSFVGLCVAMCAGCGQQVANAEQPPPVSETATKLLAATPASPDQDPGVEGQADESIELRRGYGAVDMRFNACVSRKNDQVLSGAGCPPGFVIYGPYVQVPGSAEIEVAFDIRSNKRMELYADIVSRMGAQTLAGLNRQRIEAGISQKLGYRVYVFNAEANVESRIGVKAEPGTEFEIADLTMTVR